MLFWIKNVVKTLNFSREVKLIVLHTMINLIFVEIYFSQLFFFYFLSFVQMSVLNSGILSSI